MFLPKFDTLNHPLFKECGSKYEGYTQNCTNVEEEYAPIWENRLKEYHKMYQDYTSAEAESKKEYEDMIEAENTALEEASNTKGTRKRPTDRIMLSLTILTTTMMKKLLRLSER